MIGAGLAGLFGLASKENAAVLPVLILLYEWFFFQNLDRAWLKKQAGRIGLAAALLFIIIYVYLGGTPVEKLMGMYEKRSFTPGQRLLTEPRVVLYYLTLLAYPHPSRLNLDYNFPLSISLLHPAVTLPAILALLGLVAGAVYAARRHRLLAFAVLWFLVTLSIESSVVGLALIFEHRTYLPSVFLFIAATVLLNEYIRPKSLSLGILGILILLSAVWTYQRNCVWSDVLRLWQDGAAKSPQSPRILNNLGMAYKNINQIEKARQAFQAALAGDPEMISALNNLGMIMLQAGHPEAGLARFEKAIAIEPGYYDAHYNRGLALLEMGKINAAAAAFQEALRLNPFYVEAHNNLGVTLMRRLEIDSAITHFRRALKLNPAFLEAYNNMGLAYYKKGLADKAFEWFNRALDLDPFHVDAYNNMRRLRAKFNRYESPIKRLQNRLRREPDNPPLVFRLAEVYQQAGMLYPALQHYEKALALQPEAVDYLNQLGIFYAEHNQYRRAAEMFERLSDLLPNTPVFHYNLACLYARMGDKKKALHHLETAVKNGYDNLEQIISDKDLENLRDTEYLKTLTTIVKDREGG